MYSGTTIHNSSGNVMGAHQKIDRVARRHLSSLLPDTYFPSIKLILHFEGKNGPDGVKRKSPAQDEPWHYYDPKSTSRQPLLDIIDDHFRNLVKELRRQNDERAAFEAAWLAHALVDGLTPAHHFPYEEELTKLRGEGLETRDSLKEKLVIGGDTTLDVLKNNWKMWGAKGLMTTHGLFEWGVAAIITPLRLNRGKPTAKELQAAQKEGVVKVFQQEAKAIDNLEMFQQFYRLGWTKKLARTTREDLTPALVKTVVVAWYLAAQQAGKKR